MYEQQPCPLCGIIHLLQLHSFPRRSWVDSNGERVWIQVVVIKCADARSRGKQYTKRLLPDFLIPFSPVRLDKLLEAERMRREEGASLEKCSFIMGCIDLRTVRKHLKQLYEAAASAILHLSEELAHTPQYARLPEAYPGHCCLMRLHTIQHIAFQAAGASGRQALPLNRILQQYWRHLSGTQSISCVSQKMRPP